MSCITFNQSTKEIEVKGSESFIESNFNLIQDPLIENFGVKRMMAARRAKANREPRSLVTKNASHKDGETTGHDQSEAFTPLRAAKPSVSEVPHEFTVKRAPLRKYIRKEGIPGHERVAIEVVEQKPGEISISSLKEKFGLSEAQIGGIIRDAEKLGKIRKVINGSYVWTHD